jgi:hypothetical protein
VAFYPPLFETINRRDLGALNRLEICKSWSDFRHPRTLGMVRWSRGSQRGCWRGNWR